MLDRESTFADPEIVNSLKNDFVPVAIDQAYQRRQKDTEGDFYRGIVQQSPRKDFGDGTTQGLYAVAPDGTFLGFSNNRGPERIQAMLKKALTDFRPVDSEPVTAAQTDARFHPDLPGGGLVIRVRAKVLGGYEETDDPWQKIFQSAVSRDNLWLTEAEHRELIQGTIPDRLKKRIARYHLVDNTRGEPPMWQADEVRSMRLEIEPSEPDSQSRTIVGDCHLETRDGSRGFTGAIRGILEHDGQHVTRCDFLAKGEFWGEGRFTGHAPAGKFPLAVSFELADKTDIADQIPPQASRGWIDGYWRVAE